MNYLLLTLCSNSMRRFFAIGRIIEIVEITVPVLLVALIWSTFPPKHILQRYPWTVKLRLLAPFKGWQKRVSLEDIGTFRRFRRGLLTCAVLLIGLIQSRYSILESYLHGCF
jgi:hypothetical protein